MNSCHYYMYISYKSILKFNIMTCVLPPSLQPFSYSFLFCYKITSKPIRVFQAYITILLTNKLINFTLIFWSFKEKLRRPFLQDLVSITIWLPATQILVKTHLTHLPRYSLAIMPPKCFETPFSLFSLVTRPHGYL